ncbi:PucR family transcriptional regulator [Microbacterium sp.]|uniref:PucR family transcriptional regulator n=1 Tax=Microbacterium sp. TaxID=51671 RepID=UPI00281155B0|nr:helix-turn-helix domain-containing protein [Microbacterium sp.]
MSRNLSGPVELRDLLEASSLRDLDVLHLSATTVRVQDLALIADIEEITSVGPDTVIVLSDRAAMGGWMISAALRYAWERRASALIVPDPSITDTAVELARRLDVTLLGTRQDSTRLALDVGLQIGLARAGSIARIQAFTERIAHAETLTSAMETISRELSGRAVRIESSGTVTFSAEADAGSASRTAAARGAGPAVRVSVPIYLRDRSPDALVVDTGDHERDYASQVLHAAVPSVRALLNESRLDSILDSLPPLTVTSLAGVPKTGFLDAPGQEAFERLLRWPLSGPYVAVCILTGDGERLGPAVHQLWQGSFPDMPLARVTDGWLAFAQLADGGQQQRSIAEMRTRFEAVRGLDIRVGVSRRHSSQAKIVDSVREAWISARLAGDDSPDAPAGAGSGLLVFSEIPSRLLDRLLPGELAEQLASVMMPELLADPAADEVIETVVAYLACRGSVSGAAKTLGLHRNTVQARIRRAEVLGLSLADPAEVLPTHMLLAALAGRRAVAASANRPAAPSRAL